MKIADWKRVVIFALQHVIEHENDLNELDKSLGDGDHGTTVARGMRSAIEELEQKEYVSANQVLESVGRQMMDTMGGASGVLYGVLFRGSRNCTKSSEIQPEIILEFFDKGLADLKRRSGANAGDKTMLDALIPAVDSLRADIEAGVTEIAQILEHASDAANRGRKSTSSMCAHFGRAKFLGERSLGIADPGATSMALFFEGLYKGIQSEGIEDEA